MYQFLVLCYCLQVGILSKRTGGVSEILSVLPLAQAHRLLPQTPLSILTRVEDSDVTEGYDKSRKDTDDGKSKSKSPIARLVSRFR